MSVVSNATFTHLEELIVDFERRSEKIELIRLRINLFNNPTAG